MLLFSRQGKLRLQKWYIAHPDKLKKKITRELITTILARKPKMCSFLEWKDLKVVYKRWEWTKIADLQKMKYVKKISMFKPASNDFGCICEQIWKDQCSMEVYITINRTKWCCSKLLIKLVITTKNFFKWAAVIGYM